MNILKLCDSLIEVKPEVLEKIKELEKNKEYNSHVDPIDFNNVIKVDENFKYLNKPFFIRLKYFLIYHFLVCPLEKRELRRMGFKVEGRENLKGIKSAVITSNHVNKLDSSLIRKAYKGHKVYITAANFNNQKGILGDIMRSSRMLPLGDGIDAMKNFDNAINTLLNSSNYVLFYPEQSEWWCYKKPRPIFPGAFHFSIKNKVPLIPSFITFLENGKYFKNGINMYDMTVHILKPIYPKENLSKKENLSYMMDLYNEEVKECYEKTYNRELIL